MQLTFFALSAIALLSGVRALTLNTPTFAAEGEPLDVTWETSPGDPTFSLLLVNPSIPENIALASDSDPSTGSIEVTVPFVPAGSAA